MLFRSRIEEALNVKPEHFDSERKTVTLWVTKTKATKKETRGKKELLSLVLSFLEK